MLIFLLAMGIWVRSYFDNVSILRWSTSAASTRQPGVNRTIVYGMGWSGGSLGIGRSGFKDGIAKVGDSGWVINHLNPTQGMIQPRSMDDRLNLQFGGFQWVHTVRSSNPVQSSSVTALVVPLWLFGLFAIPPLLWIRRYRRKRGRGGGFPVEVAAEKSRMP